MHGRTRLQNAGGTRLHEKTIMHWKTTMHGKTVCNAPSQYMVIWKLFPFKLSVLYIEVYN